MWVRWLWVLMVCGSLVFAQKDDRRRVSSSANVQQEIIKERLETATWKTGSLFATPILGLRQLGYDSNVFSAETNRVDDIAIAPQVGLNVLFRPNARWVWENSASYDYLYYADLENLRGSQYQGETRLHGFFKRSAFNIGARYYRDRQRLNSEIEERVYSDRLRTDLAYTLNFAARHQMDLTAAVNDLSYDESLETAMFKVLERSDTETKLRYSYKAKEWLSPFFELEQQAFDFEQAGNVRDNTDFRSFFLGLKTQGSTRLIMELKAGIMDLDFQPVPSRILGSDGEPTTGPLLDLDERLLAVEGNLRYRFTRRYYSEASILRTPLFSFNESYLSFLSSKVTLEVGVETRHHFRIGPEISFGANDYENTFDQTITTNRKDDLTGVGINLTIPFRKFYEWRFSVGYDKRDSNLPNRSDEGFRVGTTLTYK